ncbi:MAG: SRPBCC family protein [bacterium]|nr:SRPBCC family protein [bacterium]
MSDQHTVRLHRVIRAKPEKVYRAFLEPKAMCKWIPPHGFVAEVQHSDVRVGGGYKMSFTNFGTGQAHAFGGRYLELAPHERIRYTDMFADPSMPGEMHVTVTFRPVMCGTELTIVQENLPVQIPIEFCYLGWQESLTMLAQLVEPEIP